MTPAHHGFDDIWTLADGEPGPHVLRAYLRWVLTDDERRASAVASVQWTPVGFHILHVAHRVDDATGIMVEGLQVNFYHRDFTGNEHPHGHPRPARTTWYPPSDARQVITRYLPLPPGSEPVDGLPIERRQAVVNNIVDRRDGRRARYDFLPLGPALLLRQSVTRVRRFGSQDFASTEVHKVDFEPVDGVAVSVHHKGAEEPATASEPAGLVAVKCLSVEQAELVAARRRALTADLPPGDERSGPRLAPATMMYPPADVDASRIGQPSSATPPERAELLLRGALRTAESLA